MVRWGINEGMLSLVGWGDVSTVSTLLPQPMLCLLQTSDQRTRCGGLFARLVEEKMVYWLKPRPPTHEAV